MRGSLNSFTTQQRDNISRTVNDTKNFNSLRSGTIKHQHFFKSRHAENSQGREQRIFEPGVPAYLRLPGWQAKRLVRGE